MVAYLSQAWLDRFKALAAGLPTRPGATARVQHLVTGAPGGEVSYVLVYEDGKVVESALGGDPEADVTLIRTYDDSVQVAKGEVDADASYMQGRTKATGSMSKLMALLPVTQSEEHREVVTKLASETDV
ncbi:MAG: SCP2 sterol-binding domain-containing protein [Acidimicrobiales bacterium]